MRQLLLALLLVVAAFAGCTVPTEEPAPAEPDANLSMTLTVTDGGDSVTVVCS